MSGQTRLGNPPMSLRGFAEKYGVSLADVLDVVGLALDAGALRWHSPDWLVTVTEPFPDALAARPGETAH